MPEAITKYAVNSTIGTEEFKPLDKIIIGEKTFIGGTSPIAPAYVSEKYYNFIPKINGVLSVIGSVYNSSAGDAYPYSVKVYQNNIHIASWEKTISSRNTVDVKFDFPVLKGSVYKVAVYLGRYIEYSDFYFCGQVTDYNYFETEVIE